MKTSFLNSIRQAVLLPALIAIVTAVQAGEIKWPVKIFPTGSCEIDWRTTDPVQSGTLTGSGGGLTFNEGSYVYFTFREVTGHRLIHVYKNLTDEIGWVRSNNMQDSFGPVSKPHNIVAVSEVLNPTGTFGGNYSDGSGVTQVVDVTGNYAGTVPEEPTRNYNVDLAMDESGKVMGMGTVTGVSNEEGGSELSGAGSQVKTVEGQPYAKLKGSFKGGLDGRPVSASGKADGDLVMEQGTSGKQLSGVASGNAVDDGVKKSSPATERTVDVPVQSQNTIKKNWGLSVTFTEKTDAKGKKYVEANATLRLSNGEHSKFAPKKVKYSVAKGYSVSLSNGQKLNSSQQPVLDAKGNPVIDKKSKVKLTALTFSGTTGSWTPSGGTMEYKFLGQSGKGPLDTFLIPLTLW